MSPFINRNNNVKHFSLLMLACFITTFGKSQSSPIPDSLYPSENIVIPYHSETAKIRYRDRIWEFKKNPLEPNDIVFLGNSITENGGDWSKRFNIGHVKNRGISGDVTDGVLNRLGEIWYCKPKMVFILIGINDVYNSNISVSYIFNNIVKIVSVLHKMTPGTQIYVNTILPTSDYTIREKIKALNILICYKPVNYTILDMHNLFADGSDLIKKEYTIDGLHLSESGYAVWVNFLKKYFNLQ